MSSQQTLDVEVNWSFVTCWKSVRPIWTHYYGLCYTPSGEYTWLWCYI